MKKYLKKFLRRVIAGRIGINKKGYKYNKVAELEKRKEVEKKVINIVMKENRVMLKTTYETLVNKTINIIKNAFTNNNKIIIKRIKIRNNEKLFKETLKGILQRMGRGKGNKTFIKVLIPQDTILLSVHLSIPLSYNSYILSTLTSQLKSLKYLSAISC